MSVVGATGEARAEGVCGDGLDLVFSPRCFLCVLASGASLHGGSCLHGAGYFWEGADGSDVKGGSHGSMQAGRSMWRD